MDRNAIKWGMYLTQNERPVPALLALNKLVRSQSHTLPQTRDHERVRNGQQSQILGKREILRVQEYDRLVGES